MISTDPIRSTRRCRAPCRTVGPPQPNDHPALCDQLLQERSFVLGPPGLRNHPEQLPPDRVPRNHRAFRDHGLATPRETVPPPPKPPAAAGVTARPVAQAGRGAGPAVQRSGHRQATTAAAGHLRAVLRAGRQPRDGRDAVGVVERVPDQRPHPVRGPCPVLVPAVSGRPHGRPGPQMWGAPATTVRRPLGTQDVPSTRLPRTVSLTERFLAHP